MKDKAPTRSSSRSNVDFLSLILSKLTKKQAAILQSSNQGTVYLHSNTDEMTVYLEICT